MLVTVEVIRDGALDILSNMERLNLIKLNAHKNNELVQKKLSQMFAGALNLSDFTYEMYQKSIQESRNEWSKDIY